MELLESALKILSADRIRNANMINFIRDYPVELIEIAGKSVLIKGKSDKDWIYISSESVSEFEELLDRINPDEKYFAVLEDWMLNILSKKRKTKWKLSCKKLYFPDSTPLQDIKELPDPLFPSKAEEIYRKYGYRSYTDIDYIRERIEKGPSFGIYDGDLLVGWIMSQDDGAIGLLQVMESHRRKGYARILLLKMIEAILIEGGVPFVQIEESNVASMSLSLNLGFKEDRNVHWVMFE